MSHNPSPDFLTLGAAADYVGVSKDTLRRWMHPANLNLSGVRAAAVATTAVPTLSRFAGLALAVAIWQTFGASVWVSA